MVLHLSRYFRNPSNIATVTGDMTDNLSAKFIAFSLPYFLILVLRIVHTVPKLDCDDVSKQGSGSV
jgi:hypothetical protein